MVKDYYPEPAFRRKDWVSLNGCWNFCFDDDRRGLNEGWETEGKFPMLINVPYAYQSKSSGIGDAGYHPVLWYSRDFKLSGKELSGSVFLNFNAVDYECDVYVNGRHVGGHKGGYASFSFEIHGFCREGENLLVVRVEDWNDTAQPRGKQDWTGCNWGCWYTPSSGIWQDVWLSFSGCNYISSVMLTPDFERQTVTAAITYPKGNGKGLYLSYELFYNDTFVASGGCSAKDFRQIVDIHIDRINAVDDVHTWTPEHPNLFHIKFILKNAMGEIDDVVMTYTGMRTVTTRNGQVLLNFRPLYQRLVLDQGYWKDGLLTGTPDEIERDLDLVKKMGFNGVRKHQKFESPWFYYQADVKGVLVWAELPSAYEFCFSEIENLTEDMIGAVQRLYNHPSIVTWVPLNESWGVRDIFFNESMQHFSVGLYHLLKALDPNRLVSVNDGWEQTVSDISALHDYMSTDEASLRKRWGDEEAVEKTAVSNRQSYASGYSKGDAPLLITEFGGTALAPDAVGGAWGYRNPAANKEELLSRISSIVRAIRNDGSIKGFCYTQLTDVMQEVNGLLDENHVPKCPVEDYSRIFGEEN